MHSEESASCLNVAVTSKAMKWQSATNSLIKELAFVSQSVLQSQERCVYHYKNVNSESSQREELAVRPLDYKSNAVTTRYCTERTNFVRSGQYLVVTAHNKKLTSLLNSFWGGCEKTGNYSVKNRWKHFCLPPHLISEDDLM